MIALIVYLLAGLLFGEALTMDRNTFTAMDLVVYIMVLLAWPIFMPIFIYRAKRKQ